MKKKIKFYAYMYCVWIRMCVFYFFIFFTTIGSGLSRRTSLQITPINRHFSSSAGGGGYVYLRCFLHGRPPAPMLVYIPAERRFYYRWAIAAATRRGPVYYTHNLFCLLRPNRLPPCFSTTRKPNRTTQY